MIYHDGRRDSLAFFREHRDLIGEIVSVTMDDHKVDVILYCFKIIGEMGEIWLSNWYLYVDTIVRELGYPEDAIKATKSGVFVLGPPSRWKPRGIFRDEVRRDEATLSSAEEVLDFLHEFSGENGFMPIAREIMLGCDSITSQPMAHDRLYLLRDQGSIHIHRRRVRGIVLL